MGDSAWDDARVVRYRVGGPDYHKYVIVGAVRRSVVWFHVLECRWYTPDDAAWPGEEAVVALLDAYDEFYDEPYDDVHVAAPWRDQEPES